MLKYPYLLIPKAHRNDYDILYKVGLRETGYIIRMSLGTPVQSDGLESFFSIVHVTGWIDTLWKDGIRYDGK